MPEHIHSGGVHMSMNTEQLLPLPLPYITKCFGRSSTFSLVKPPPDGPPALRSTSSSGKNPAPASGGAETPSTPPRFSSSRRRSFWRVLRKGATKNSTTICGRYTVVLSKLFLVNDFRSTTNRKTRHTKVVVTRAESTTSVLVVSF